MKRLILAVLVATLAITPGRVLADGDPASDVLLGQNVFYPYQPAVSQSLQNQLNAVANQATQAKFPLKVALIASPIDLGVIPDLFGKPQNYADFLDQEISFQTRQPLLVVMAAGYGVQGVPAAAKAAAAGLTKPQGSQSDALAKAAITAVRAMAKAAGHDLGGGQSSGAGGSGNDSTRTILLLALILAALATAGTLVAMRRRHGAGT